MVIINPAEVVQSKSIKQEQQQSLVVYWEALASEAGIFNCLLAIFINVPKTGNIPNSQFYIKKPEEGET